MISKSEVTLIPWDPLSESHREWLYKQRVECSWDMDKVEEIWRDAQIKGEKCIYWIVLPPSDLEGVGSDKLVDTAASINAVPRQPSQIEFVPIGHISLDSKCQESDRIELEIPTEGVFWIKTFFVSRSRQGKGIGRAAMDEVEGLAAREPLCAKTLLLSTLVREDQMRGEYAKVAFGASPKIINQDWYSRRGYRSIKIVENFFDVRDKTGKRWDTKAIFMRKDIA
ncbi:uncharacterized protein N7498_000287 [Penicillium cinerascens]|uniref:N-acetyltransferase domain-containing protein n=1 Tax=Penicillium cinerascens TaxID=70096 RepID=A0A9W9NE50_9EURO|nr:uncharacterized protein N7498_000287 [Penicillium cinerascens]KAJ5218188.1 hypothetical protein N7498_000287 [Penicillium cinerascens]